MNKVYKCTKCGNACRVEILKGYMPSSCLYKDADIPTNWTQVLDGDEPEQPPVEDSAYNEKDENGLTKNIRIVWSVEDVLAVRPELTAEQCSEVLNDLAHYHDSTVGINWDTIRTTADELFPERT